MSSVARATAWVSHEASKANIHESQRYNIEVCVEEALANLVEHGCAIGSDKHITIAIDTDDEGVTVTVTDRCAPFDPTEAAVPPRPSASDMRAGGQGLRLMRAFADEVVYQVAPDGNELTLRFRNPA